MCNQIGLTGVSIRSFMRQLIKWITVIIIIFEYTLISTVRVHARRQRRSCTHLLIRRWIPVGNFAFGKKGYVFIIASFDQFDFSMFTNRVRLIWRSVCTCVESRFLRPSKFLENITICRLFSPPFACKTQQRFMMW